MLCTLTMPATPILHILIVDDNTICARILAHMVELEQLKGVITFKITIHHSPEAALPDLKNTKYDIIFTDIEMTKMSGCDMARIIRDKLAGNIHKENRNIPIIAVTSKYDVESLRQYEGAGITECLRKPATRDSIHKIIESRMKQLMVLM